MPPSWLPGLLDYSGDLPTYIETVFARYKADLSAGGLAVFGVPVIVPASPLVDGKPRTFWHLVSEDSSDFPGAERGVSISRCERIGWVRAIIDHHTDPTLKRWTATRNGKRNLLLALPDFDYVAIFALLDGAAPPQLPARGRAGLLTACPGR